MKFMKNLSQKKLAKSVVCGLLVSGGIFTVMGQADAKTYISGAELDGKLWKGTNITFSLNKGDHEYKNDEPVIGSGTNNTINVVDYTDYYIDAISNFQNLNFYIHDTDSNKALNHDLLIPRLFDFKSVKNINVSFGPNVKLALGDEVFLLSAQRSWDSKDDNPDDKEDKIFYSKATANDFQDYEFAIKRTSNDIIALITGIKKNAANEKSPIETQTAGLTVLTSGADMLANKGFDNAASAVANEVKEGGSANTLTPFVTVGGAKTKVNSGSHIDVNGWHLNVGLAKELKNKYGTLLIGPVVEYGKGSYDSYLDNGFHGEGKTRNIGGGVMAKQTNDNGFYYEGSLRAGKLRNDYKSQGISSNDYDSDSTYYAAHVGVGKIVKLSEKNTMDYYGKYFYTHQKDDDTIMHAGNYDYKLHLDSVDSNRTRLGVRYTHAMNEKSSVYAGMAWQHEFSGTARATIDGSGTASPSVKGNTGIMELGWKVEAGKNLDLDLNAAGYTGKQKGASLNLAVNFKF